VTAKTLNKRVMREKGEVRGNSVEMSEKKGVPQTMKRVIFLSGVL